MNTHPHHQSNAHVPADTEQTVFSDVISQGSEHPLDLLPSWMPSVDIRARRLDINYRCVGTLIWSHAHMCADAVDSAHTYRPTHIHIYTHKH